MKVRQAAIESLKKQWVEDGPVGLIYNMLFVWNGTSWTYLWIALTDPKAEL